MPLPPRAPASVKPQPPGQKFRAAIEQARQEGIDTDALLLRLTLGDVSRLKRDPDISVGEISFEDGAMRFLNVKVAEGGVDASALVILQA
jgi:hypothetical protein